ncbi:NAD(P)-binding domain-containing protein [Pseudophaeobacter flagellatus]
MVRNLVRAGHEVTVWNRTLNEAADFAREVGCDVTNSLVELATRPRK